MLSRSALWLSATVGLALALISCSSSNPNSFRVLTELVVTPATADGQNSNNGQVVFTATGTFSLPPISAPVTFKSPYTGQFVVEDPAIATVVATGAGTVTVQCAVGASGSVNVVASAAANNGTNTVVSGSGQLTCP